MKHGDNEMKQTKAKLGTVIHATVNPRDLIPAFIEELDRLREAESFNSGRTIVYGREDDALGEIERGMSADGYYDSESSMHDLEWLFDRLDEYAPDGCYFGAHEGDGSDFGFWQGSAE